MSDFNDVKYCNDKAPTAQSNKGPSSLQKKLHAAFAVADALNAEEAPQLGLVEETVSLAEKAKRVFSSWWQEIVKFFKRAAGKARNAAAAIREFFRSLLKNLVTFFSESYERTRAWFAGMSAVADVEVKMPPLVADTPAALIDSSDLKKAIIAFVELHERRSLYAWQFMIKKKNVMTAEEQKFFLALLGVILSQVEPAELHSEVDFAKYIALAQSSEYVQGDSIIIPADLEIVEAQGGNWLDLLSPAAIANFFATVTACIIGGLQGVTKFFDSFSAADFSASFNSFLMSYNNFKRSEIADLIEWTIDKLVFFVSGTDFSTKYGTSRRWKRVVDELGKDLDTASRVRNVSPLITRRICNNLAEMATLFPLMQEFFPRQSSATSSVYNDLNRRGALYDSGVVPVNRHKPVVVVLRGAAGVGKTTIQKAIINNVLTLASAALANTDGSEEELDLLREMARNPSHFPYNCAETKAEYDDGYKNQPFVTFEELCTVTDPKIKRDWLLKFFRTIDSEPLLLNMAFADKGKRYFNSPFVIATTNSKRFDTSSFSDPVALYRRIDLDFVVTVTPGPFKLENVSLTLTKECRRIICDERLCPSRYLHKLSYSWKEGKIDVKGLVNMLAVIYLERLHDFRDSRVDIMDFDPNFMDNVKIFDGASRNPKLAMIGRGEKKKTVTRKKGYISLELVSKDNVPVINAPDCCLKRHQVIEILNHYKQPDDSLHASIYLRDLDLVCKHNTYIRFRSGGKNFYFPARGGDGVHPIRVFLEGNIDARAKCDGKSDSADKGKDKEKPSGDPTVSLSESGPADKGKDKEEPLGPPIISLSEEAKRQIVTDKLVIDPKLQVPVTAQMDQDWYGDNEDVSFNEKFEYLRCLCTPMIDILPIDVREYYHIITQHFIAGEAKYNGYIYGVQSAVRRTNVNFTIPRGGLAVIRAYIRATKTYAHVRKLALALTVDSPLRAKTAFFKKASFVFKHLRSILVAVEQDKRYFQTMGDEEMLGVFEYASLGQEFTPPQIRAANHHLKKFGKQIGARGKLVPLPAEQVRAYNLRVRKNKERNAKKNVQREAERKREQDNYASLKSRADVDRRVGRNRAQLRRRQRNEKTWVEPQLKTRKVSPEQMLCNLDFDSEEMVVTIQRTWSPFRKGGSLFPILKRFRVWSSRQYLSNLLNANPAGGTNFVVSLAQAVSLYRGLETASDTDYENWGGRFTTFMLFIAHLGRLYEHDWLPEMESYARLHLPQTAIMREETAWRAAAVVYAGVIMKLTVEQAVEFVDYYCDGTAAPSLCEIFSEDEIASALTSVLSELPTAEINQRKPGHFSRFKISPEDAEVAPLVPVSAAELALIVSASLAGIGIVGSIVWSFYQLYKAFSVRDTMEEFNETAIQKKGITEAELREYEEKIREAGYIPLYHRVENSDRVKLPAPYLGPQSIDVDPKAAPDVMVKTVDESKLSSVVISQNNLTPLLKKIAMNSYRMYKTCHQGHVPLCDIFFIKGRIAMLPTHCLEYIKSNPNDAFRFEPMAEATTRKAFVVKANRILVLRSGTEHADERALVMFDLHHLPSHPDMMKHFREMSDWEKDASGFYGFMVGVDDNREFYINQVTDGLLTDRPVRHLVDGVIKKVELSCPQDCYNTDGAVPGACGRLIIVPTKTGPGIRGFHVSGQKEAKVGRSVVVTKSFLQEVIMTNNIDVLTEPHLVSLEDDDPVVYGAYTIEPGSITSVVHTNALDRTNLRPTVFAEQKFDGECPVAPARMTEETLLLARAKETKREACWEAHPDAVQIAMRYAALIAMFFMNFTKTIIGGCRRLKISEGLGEYPGLNPFNPTTSEGFRLKIHRIKKKKLLGYDGTPPDPTAVLHFSQDIKSYLKLGDEEMRFPRQVNFDKLKDELLQKEFVEAGKCRLFNITDFYDNFLIKLALGALVARMGKNFAFGPQTCGLNMRGSMAREIYETFAGRVVLAFDVSGFDNTVNAIGFYVLAWLIRNAYAKRSHRMWAYWAILATYQSLRFDRGSGRCRGHGNTSGNWMTTWLNTITNICYFCIATIYLAYKHNDDPVQVIRDLRLRVYSDDNLSSLDRPWYTPVNLKEAFWHLFKVELTNADKSEVTDASVYTIDDAEFLSRTFRYSGGLVFCPLALPSLMGQLYYVRVPRGLVRTKAFIMQQLATNLKNVASELYEYDSETGDAIARKIFAFLEQNNVAPALFPYSFNYDRNLFKIANC